METLLIVEDEKKVRDELVRLVKKSDVKVNQILECCNGREALELIRNVKVDLVFTDIRMPEMNGCELTEAIANLEIPGTQIRTKVVIISGFENFQCAVELLKYGAKDYILKPATFEAVNDVLQRMDMEITREKKRLQEIDWVYRQHVRNLLRNGEQENEEAWEILLHTFEEKGWLNQNYRLVLANPSEEKFPGVYHFFLDKVNGDLYLIHENDFESWKDAHARGFCIGISRTHMSVCEIAVAYREALEARKVAFIRGVEAEVYEEWDWENNLDLGAETEKFMQFFFTNKIDQARKRFRNLCFEAKHRKVCPVKVVELSEELSGRLLKTYENTCSKKSGQWDCPMPLGTLNAETFIEEFDAWMVECQKVLELHMENTKKNDKIMQAVEYIHENYQKDLNLAMVSNHISMNYSMFSNAFKQYTGVNFVNYLKDIRIREAKKLLERTDKKIAEIGALVGYGNDKHFMKTFKAICGVSPSEYRRNVEITRRQTDLL